MRCSQMSLHYIIILSSGQRAFVFGFVRFGVEKLVESCTFDMKRMQIFGWVDTKQNTQWQFVRRERARGEWVISTLCALPPQTISILYKSNWVRDCCALWLRFISFCWSHHALLCSIAEATISRKSRFLKHSLSVRVLIYFLLQAKTLNLQKWCSYS